MVLRAVSFHLNLSPALFPARVCASCQIRRMEQLFHIAESISGTCITPQVSSLPQNRHLNKGFHSNLSFHAQSMAFTRVLMPLQCGSHWTAASSYSRLSAIMLCFKSGYSDRISELSCFIILLGTGSQQECKHHNQALAEHQELLGKGR